MFFNSEASDFPLREPRNFSILYFPRLLASIRKLDEFTFRPCAFSKLLSWQLEWSRLRTIATHRVSRYQASMCTSPQFSSRKQRLEARSWNIYHRGLERARGRAVHFPLFDSANPPIFFLVLFLSRECPILSGSCRVNNGDPGRGRLEIDSRRESNS